MKIDTKTTAGKIAVMQAFEDGKHIEAYKNDNFGWTGPVNFQPLWRWGEFDYRIKPQTVQDAAEQFIRSKADVKFSKNSIHFGFVAGAEWQKSKMIDDIIEEKDE